MVKKSQIGLPCKFCGYDGKVYDAIVENVRRGIVSVSYTVTRPDFTRERIVANVDQKHNRVEI